MIGIARPACRFSVMMALAVMGTGAAADDAVVTAEIAEIKSGPTTLATAKMGQSFQVVEVREPWYRIRFKIGEKIQTGWIHADQIRVEAVPESSPPPQLTDADRLKEAEALKQKSLELYGAGKIGAAVPPARRAMEIIKHVRGESHVDYASSLEVLGALLDDANDFAQAEPLLLEALAVKKSVLGESHPLYALSLEDLAARYERRGEMARALPLYRQTLEIERRVLGDDHPDLAPTLDRLASLYDALEQPADAEPLYRESLEIRQQAHGDSDPEYADALTRLGLSFRKRGDFTEAESLLLKAHKIRRESLGLSDPGFAAGLDDLARLYEQSGDLAAAEPLLEQLIEITKREEGESDPRHAAGLRRLGLLYARQGRYAEAQPLLDQAAAASELVHGVSHQGYARSLHDRALLHRAMGEIPEARVLLLQAYEIRKAALGESHPDTVDTLVNLAAVLSALRDVDQAGEMASLSRRMARREAVRVLPGASRQEQLASMYGPQRRHFEECLSLGFRERGDSGFALLSGEWLLNGKAVTLESLAERARPAGLAEDESTQRRLDELAAVRKRLALSSLDRTASDPHDANPPASAELEQQEAQLTQQLAAQGLDVAQPALWHTVEELRAALPVEAVLIDIVRFHRIDIAGQPQGPRYAAWVVPPATRGDVQIVDLGDADVIDEAVAAARLALKLSGERIGEVGEVEAEEALLEPLGALAARILQPLLAKIGGAKQLIISPDASLWLVPWSALPLKGGRYAVEDFEIRYVVSGRDLLEEAASGLSISPPAIFADPDFDLAAGQAVALDPHEKRGAVDSLRPAEPLARLPATADAARSLAPLVDRYTRAAPQLFLGEEASEGAYRQLRHPAVLMLSAPTTFLTDQDVAIPSLFAVGEESRGLVLTARGQPVANPLARFGLLLAGCNCRDEESPPAGDGVLTGSEILEADLRGTRLVVLSEAEPGSGTPLHGEGAAGLQQAFRLAGARSVLSSLWRTPESESTRLLKDFFAELSDGQSGAAALRSAQRSCITRHRKTSGAAHPLNWAAFTLTE